MHIIRNTSNTGAHHEKQIPAKLKAAKKKQPPGRGLFSFLTGAEEGPGAPAGEEETAESADALLESALLLAAESGGAFATHSY